METDAISLEETRLKDVGSVDDYNMVHERHRIFPAVFEDREHERILDLSAGVGVVAKRIKEMYAEERRGCRIVCNDQSPTCLRLLKELGVDIVSFNLDDHTKPYPLADGSFDAIICLSTIEHLMNIDNCIDESRRILSDDGRLYLSAPNYSGLPYLIPFLLSGKTFHDPMGADSKYEFYAHVRYFTYRTLCDFTSSRGFDLDSVYLGVPKDGTRYRRLYSRSQIAALTFKGLVRLLYEISSPRWASEPVLCFRKTGTGAVSTKPRKVVL